MSTIEKNDWLAEMERLTAKHKNDGGWTTREWAVKLGLSEKTAAERLRKIHDQGRLKLGHRSHIRMDGKPCLVPVYSIIPAKKGK